MKGIFSLEHELRAIRLGNGAKAENGSTQPPDPQQTDRPWQEDIEQVQQTMREVLRAIASLSGVELPGLPPDQQNGDATLPQLDILTLKDRIRKDLEAFSTSTAAELAKQAQEQARAALGAVQDEMSGRIEQVAGEFRGKLEGRLEPEQLDIDVMKQSQERVAELIQAQTDEFARWVWLTCKGTGAPIPVQIEKLLEPHVEEAAAKLAGSFRQKVQELFAEQEQWVQERSQGMMSSLQSQVQGLEQTAQQICEQKVDSIAQMSAERLNAAADEAARNFESRVRTEVEGALGRATSRIESSLDNSLETYRQQLAQITSSGLEEQRKVIADSMADLHTRLRQAAEILVRADAA